MAEIVIDHKVLHREWDEITIYAQTFMDNYSYFNYDFYPKFNFENGYVEVDELWGVVHGRVSLLSQLSGVTEWDDKKGQYIKHCHFRETELGQLVSVTFVLSEVLADRIPHLLQRSS